MNKRTILKTGAFLLVLVGTAYAIYGVTQPSSPLKTVRKTSAVDHSKMERMVTYVKPKAYVGTKSAITSYLGEIQTEKNGQIYAYRNGIIEAYFANVGDSVKKGQIVAKLLPAEYSADIANMIADRKAERTRSEGMVASSERFLADAKARKTSITGPIDERVAAVIREQDAKISKLKADLAALDVEIGIAEKSSTNVKTKTDASVTLESDKLALRETTVKNAVKNAHSTLVRIFYGSSNSLTTTSDLKNIYFGARDSKRIAEFTNLMSPFHGKFGTIDSLSNDAAFTYAKEAALVVDAGLRLLDATIVSSDYSESELSADKADLLEAKTDSMNGILTILNEYEEQKSMLAKETSDAASENVDSGFMIEKLKSERLVVEKEISMSIAEKNRMAAGESSERAMSFSESDRMITEAEKMVTDAKSSYRAATEALGVLESAGFSNEVRAPFSGKIARRNINAGESIAMGTPLYDIVGSDAKKGAPKAFVRFEIPESDLLEAMPGKEVRFYRTSEPLRKLTATIVRVSPAVGSATKGIIIEAEFSPSTKNLPIGSTVRVEMEKSGNMLLIPSSSVVQSDDGDLSVFTIDNKDVIRSKPISTERTVGLDVYVSSGISKDDKIVELPKNYTFLEDGVKVSPMEKPTVSAPAGIGLAVPDEHKNH
jgi:RND family efflux transporter MFP subunit